MAPWSTRFTAVGAVPKMVCQRTACDWSTIPAGSGRANCAPACAAPGNASLLKLKPTSPGKSDRGGGVFAELGMENPGFWWGSELPGSKKERRAGTKNRDL